MKPINRVPRLIRIATAVIVAGGLAVMVLSAQNNLDTLRQAAEQGDARAQFNLGFMYHEGKGVPQDAAEAVRWFRLAAEQGNAAAQFNLGFMYSEGRGVLKDEAEAVRWYRLAAEQGDAPAQFNLGNMYSEGRGVPKDDAEAVRWFRMAAGRGMPLRRVPSGPCTPSAGASPRIPYVRTCGSTSQAPTGTKRPGNNETTSKTT